MKGVGMLIGFQRDLSILSIAILVDTIHHQTLLPFFQNNKNTHTLNATSMGTREHCIEMKNIGFFYSTLIVLVVVCC